jgi:hypothetical protein
VLADPESSGGRGRDRGMRRRVRCRESQKDPGLGLVLREIPVLQLKYLCFIKN